MAESASQELFEKTLSAFRDLSVAHVKFYETISDLRGHLSKSPTPDDKFISYLVKLVGAHNALFNSVHQAISLNIRLALDIRYGKISPEQRASCHVSLSLASHSTVSLPLKVSGKSLKERKTILQQLLEMAPKRDEPFVRWNGFIENALATTGAAPSDLGPMAQSICEQYGDLLVAAFDMDVIATRLEAVSRLKRKGCSRKHYETVSSGLGELQELFYDFEAAKSAYFNALERYEGSLSMLEQVPNADILPSIDFQCGFCPLKCIKSVCDLHEELSASPDLKEKHRLTPLSPSPASSAQQMDDYADLSSQLQLICLRRFVVPKEFENLILDLDPLKDSGKKRLDERTRFLSETLPASQDPSNGMQKSILMEQLKTFCRRLHKEGPLYYSGYLGSDYSSTQAALQLQRIASGFPKHFEPELKVLQPKRAACSKTPNAAILVAKACLLRIASKSASLEALLCELKLGGGGGGEDGKVEDAMEMRLERRRSDGSSDRTLSSLLVELRDATTHFWEASHYYGSRQDVLLAVGYLETTIWRITVALRAIQSHPPGQHQAADSVREEADSIQQLVDELQALYERRIFIAPERRADYWLTPRIPVAEIVPFEDTDVVARGASSPRGAGSQPVSPRKRHSGHRPLGNRLNGLQL